MLKNPSQGITSLLEKLRDKKMRIATAESCTGGLIASTICSISGVSDLFERGFVTYCNESKTEMLGVPEKLIKQYGAVSEEVAAAMAKGALKNSHADIAVSVTGIAGPDGGSKEKPVGLVYIAVATKEKSRVTKNNISGGRNQIQKESLERAIKLVDSFL